MAPSSHDHDQDRRRPILDVVFFKTEAGNEPVREWLRGLVREDRRTVGEDIKTAQLGWPLGMPLIRKNWEWLLGSSVTYQHRYRESDVHSGGADDGSFARIPKKVSAYASSRSRNSKTQARPVAIGVNDEKDPYW